MNTTENARTGRNRFDGSNMARKSGESGGNGRRADHGRENAPAGQQTRQMAIVANGRNRQTADGGDTAVDTVHQSIGHTAKYTLYAPSDHQHTNRAAKPLADPLMIQYLTGVPCEPLTEDGFSPILCEYCYAETDSLFRVTVGHSDMFVCAECYMLSKMGVD